MIYLLEDDNSIRKLVSYTLNNNGMESKDFAVPSEFWAAMKENTPGLILLDIMLPEEDGLSILSKLRKNPDTARIPVIMLTAKATEFDKVIGLDTGADDYIAKPFGMMELISRIKAVLRRTNETESFKEYQVGSIYVCPSKHIVKVNGLTVSLSLKEFNLLCLLVEKNGCVVNRDEILNAVWGYSFDGENRTVDVHIRKLRQKLGDAGNCIETVKGVGYKIGVSGNV
ncbi:MAG: response regulator transcription factor [Oscillospiraceae bacterium]|nr:response regulator transcription factor [Oscillospiraceae bacterium]